MVIRRRAVLFSLATPLLVAQKEEPYALIAGTVFRPNGTSLPGVEVAISAVPAEEGKKAKKPKVQRQTSNQRGEFSFRVPAKPMRYTLSVRTSGYKPLEKTVEVAGDERQDVSLMLESGT
ncbi:MAG: carboxypeptidase-like regulatory domain-containing protein [Bryobacteraceae bacterium]|nr:carboxypeptidase-like regulatory domain-containing protein [Bryobacteraceae bacterium]